MQNFGVLQLRLKNILLNSLADSIPRFGNARQFLQQIFVLLCDLDGLGSGEVVVISRIASLSLFCQPLFPSIVDGPRDRSLYSPFLELTGKN